MSITLDKAYLEDVSNGLYTVGAASTNTVTEERFARLVNSTEPRLKSDGLIQDGALVSGAEWGAAYLVADILHRTKLMGSSDLVKESWGGDYSYEFRAKTVTEMSVDYFITKYLEVVNSLNSDEFGITDAITDGAERADSEIEFTQLDRNGPALIKPSTSELIKRWS
jgi:hypothetical protein